MRIKKIWTKIKDSLIRPVQDKKNTRDYEEKSVNMIFYDKNGR